MTNRSARLAAIERRNRETADQLDWDAYYEHSAAEIGITVEEVRAEAEALMARAAAAGVNGSLDSLLDWYSEHEGLNRQELTYETKRILEWVTNHGNNRF